MRRVAVIYLGGAALPRSRQFKNEMLKQEPGALRIANA
jgi:hypothetical protein